MLPNKNSIYTISKILEPAMHLNNSLKKYLLNHLIFSTPAMNSITPNLQNYKGFLPRSIPENLFQNQNIKVPQSKVNYI